MDSGVSFGITSWNSVCEECNFLGEPIVFDSEKEYKKFKHAITSEMIDKKLDKKGKDDLSNLSDKEKEVIELLKECEDEPSNKPMSTWPENKSWWPEIIIALCFTIITMFSGLVNLTAVFGLSGAIIYTLVGFFTEFVIILSTIIIIEYIILSIFKVFKRN